METHSNLTLIVILSVAIMLLLFVLVILLVLNNRKKFLIQQNQLEHLERDKELETIKAILNTQETERKRIAQNLHDSIGAELSIVQFNLTRYIHELANSNCNIVALSEDVIALENTIESIRNICHDLYPLTLKRYGLMERLKQSTARLNESGKIQCTFTTSFHETELTIGNEEKINLFRVYMEIMSNILKHASASVIKIESKINAKQISIDFEHNGLYFTDNEANKNLKEGKGLGLSSIHNRMELMGGRINYTNENGLSRINLSIPL